MERLPTTLCVFLFMSCVYRHSSADCTALLSTAVTNGKVVTTALTTSSTATYSCDTGYTLSGTATRACADNGSWNGAAPTCKKGSFGDCTGDPKACSVHTIHTECEQDKCVCSDGYYKDGNICVAEDCDALADPGVVNGAVQTTAITHGSTATYSCHAGYSLSGAATRTCQAGKWNGTAPTCKQDCDDLVASGVVNGTVQTTAITHGSTATYRCDAGYSLSGAATRTCKAGTWNGTAPTCKQDPDNFAVATSLAFSSMVATLAIHLFF